MAELNVEQRLQRLGQAAADLVQPGMRVGLGTGSTAHAVILELGCRVASGLVMTGVPTSAQTAALASNLGIPLATLDECDCLDLGIDGADEIDPELNAIKGRGGALLHEKLVALACDAFVIVASTEKDVHQLGSHCPLPVEIVPFGWTQTAKRVAALGIQPALRPSLTAPDQPYVTDNGCYILDCRTGPITDPAVLALSLKSISGVVDHGLFLGLATAALQVNPEGAIVWRERPRP